MRDEVSARGCPHNGFITTRGFLVVLSRKTNKSHHPPPKSFLYKKVVEAQLQRTKPHTDTPPFQYAFWRKSLRRHDCSVFVL